MTLFQQTAKLRVLVTCGPTREPLDPVRFISNRSTGILGIELARAFAARGHQVVLAAGPIELPATLGPRVRVERFETARELHRLCLKSFFQYDAVCMTAAVADFRPAVTTKNKIHRGSGALTIRLVPNQDILADLGRRKRAGQVLIGFSVESEGIQQNSRAKLVKKNLDLLAAQEVGARKQPFGGVLMNLALFSGGTKPERFKRIAKKAFAEILARKAEGILYRKRAAIGV
jgi:phosphopantothenoylcysteine decarboxylase/phosphopantothenate--cysteine ligase